MEMFSSLSKTTKKVNKEVKLKSPIQQVHQKRKIKELTSDNEDFNWIYTWCRSDSKDSQEQRKYRIRSGDSNGKVGGENYFNSNEPSPEEDTDKEWRLNSRPYQSKFCKYCLHSSSDPPATASWLWRFALKSAIISTINSSKVTRLDLFYAGHTISRIHPDPSDPGWIRIRDGSGD